MPFMVIANRLTDGRIVFLAADNAWVTDIADGLRADDAPAGDLLLDRGKAAELLNQVVEPCVIEVAVENGRPRPLEYREFIRAYGPSVPLPTDPD